MNSCISIRHIIRPGVIILSLLSAHCSQLLYFLLGGGVFWVKFFPALFGALTLFLVWKSIEQLKGNLFALCLGATGVLISALLRLNMLYQPNSFDVLCWTGFYFAIISYVTTENRKWLYYAAIIFALGFLNKYNIIFLSGRFISCDFA
jgi:4-amino-4-deoxy-L-arabinose transferase-like glycosyltransferase